MTQPRLSIDAVMAAIFEESGNPLAEPFGAWVKASRRFRAFAEQYRDKIRKKLRLAEGEEMLKSLQLELEVAYRIVQDTRCTLEYEKYGSSKHRSPDFTVTFRANTLINVEVTRIYAVTETGGLAGKLVSAACDKVGQMQPNALNVLVVAAEAAIDEAELGAAMKGLRLNAEQKNHAFFTSRGFKDANEFLRQFQQVSAIVGKNGAGAAANVVWLNSLAKRPLSGEMARWAAGL